MERRAQIDPGCFEKDPDPGMKRVVAEVGSSWKSGGLGQVGEGVLMSRGSDRTRGQGIFEKVRLVKMGAAGCGMEQ